MAQQLTYSNNRPKTLGTMKIGELFGGNKRISTDEGTIYRTDLLGRPLIGRPSQMTKPQGVSGVIAVTPKGEAVTNAMHHRSSAGFAFKPKDTETDRLLKKQKAAQRVKFEGTAFNKASIEDLQYIEDMEFPLSFEPTSTVISKIEYNSDKQIMKATFSNNGAEVIYGGVPLSVYERLYYVNVSGRSVGAEFWDLVRVQYRGSLLKPKGQADPDSWDTAGYRKHVSNFYREGSQYPHLRSYDISNNTRGRGAATLERDRIDAEAQRLEAEEAERKAFEEDAGMTQLVGDNDLYGGGYSFTDTVRKGEDGRTVRARTRKSQGGRGAGVLKEVEQNGGVWTNELTAKYLASQAADKAEQSGSNANAVKAIYQQAFNRELKKLGGGS